MFMDGIIYFYLNNKWNKDHFHPVGNSGCISHSGCLLTANARIFLGISVKKRKKNGASLPERRIPLDIPESLRNIPLSTQLAPFFLFFFMDIPRNILTLARGLYRPVPTKRNKWLSVVQLGCPFL